MGFFRARITLYLFVCVLPKGGSLVGRVLVAAVNIFLSLIFGAIALVFVAIQVPGIFEMLLNGAGWIENQITTTGLDPAYNNWVRFLIRDEQLVFLGFVIVMRIVLAMVIGGIAVTLGGRRRF